MLWVKVTATFITIKQQTKQLQNEWQATWVTPLVSLISNKPRLHDQFLCDKFSYFYVTNGFGRVDETTNNCWCTWFLFKKYLWTAVSRAIKHGADTNYTFINMAGEKIWHFMWRVIYTSNFSYVTTFICHIKANALAFQQLYLPHKNCPIFLVYTGK
jgi:hypothetical protein